MKRSRALVVLAIVALAALVAFFFARPRARPARPAPVVATSFENRPLELRPDARYLVIGGGGDPDSSEVQLEADVELVRATLAGPGVTLFAGGAGRFGVREDRAPRARDDFREALGLLFLPRPRASVVRAPRYRPDGPATYERVTEALVSMLRVEGPPAMVLVASHGEGAEEEGDAFALLWGNDGLFVRDLVDLLDGPEVVRSARFVVASCYGGAFAAIDAIERPEALHCGLFATGPDRLASGCDADPDRSRHEGYLLHLMQGLAGASAGRIDLEGDGRVSLADAHVRATIVSRSFDVPLTTSEHFARTIVTERNLAWETTAPAPLEEAERIVRAIGEDTGLLDERSARAALDAVADALEDREEELAELESMRDVAWNRLRVALLERWPWLEDAYAPGWEARVARERGAIEALLMRSDLALGHREAEARVESVGVESDELRLREARIARLVRAYELERIVAALRVGAPDRVARYEALRQCERFVPALRASR